VGPDAGCGAGRGEQASAATAMRSPRRRIAAPEYIGGFGSVRLEE